MKVKILFLILSLWILLYGCATVNLKEKAVEKLECSIKPLFMSKVNSITPGDVYYLNVAAVLMDGQLIKNVDHTSLDIMSENSTFMINNQNPFNIKVTAMENNFYLVHTGGYSLSIRIKENSFPGQILTYPVDWSKINLLDYRGAQGSKGQDGRNGMDGQSGFDGGDGEDGSNGWPGGNGKDVKLVVVFYDVMGMNIPGIDDTKMLLLYNLIDKKVMLTKLQPITIDASGGKGGEGGQGGKGGKGREVFDTFTKMIKRGNDGKPGSGGQGGTGGAGGNITILYCNKAVNKYIIALSQSGAGGAGGDAGKNDPGSTIPYMGYVSDGHNGFSNQNKSITLTEMEFTAIKKLLIAIDNTYFELSRVIE